MWIFVPYVFRRYESGDVIHYFIPISVLLCCAVFGQVQHSSVFTHFIHLTAVPQAVLKGKAEPLLNVLVKTKKRAVEKRNGLGTLLVSVHFVPKRSAVSSHLPFKNENWEFISIILSQLLNSKILSNYGKSLWFSFILVFIVSARD